MSDLIVIVYPTEAKAEEVRRRLFAMQKEYIIQLADAVIATKTMTGEVKLNQLINTTAIGAVSGAFWGTLIGALFLMPLPGAAIGAASGALSGALTDFGIDDAMMKDLSSVLTPGTAALFILAQTMTADKVIDKIKDAGGTILKTSLDRTKEQALRDALGGHVTAAVNPAAPTVGPAV